MGGASAIADASALGSRETASNVVAMSVNSRAVVCATGASVPVNRLSELISRVRPVRGSDSVRATGSRWPSSAGRLASVSFSAEPRPARVFPMPTRFCWIARRVGGLKDWKMSSNCTGTFVCVIGSVPPSAITSCDVPLCRSTYLEPSTDEGRIDAVEFTGTRPWARREVQRQLRDGPAVRQLDRLHVRYQADSEASFADVAADG